MDTPQVQVPGSENPDVQNVASNSHEIEMTDTQDTTNAAPAPPPADHIGETQAEDSALPDAQPESEPPAPVKKNAGFNFLE